MTTDVWTTSAHRAPARFEAWRHALNLSHLKWELEPTPEPTFGARIRQKTLDGVRVVDCHCDPCAGWRRRPQVSRGDGAYFGILFELRGREVIRQGATKPSSRRVISSCGTAIVRWSSGCWIRSTSLPCSSRSPA